jgi:TP901 family phage tail tape measure protein
VADRTVTVNLVGRAQSLGAAFEAGKKGARDFKGELDDLGSKSPKKLNDIAMATGVAGAALLGLAGYAGKASMDFDKQMSEVSAVSNATGKDLTGLRSLAIQAGKDTQFSATEAARAEAELSKAGISTADIMGGALSGSLSLAAAGQMDLASAATIAAQTMNIFELKGKDVGHIADVLASAANSSAADMQGLGQGLQQVGLVAHRAGFSLEETTGLLAAFADRGLQGSDGATSLKTAIQRLTAPTDQARSLMDSLGISVYGANGNVKSAADLAGTLQEKLGGLNVEQRNAAMQTIFGSDAIRAANVLYSIGADGVRHYTEAVDKHGAAAETARKKTDNLAGDLERLKGSIETAAIAAGSGANGGLRDLVKVLDFLVTKFSELPGPVQTALTVLAGVGGTGLLAVAGMLKAKQTVDEFMTALRDMGPMGTRFADGMGKVAGAVGKLGLAGLGVGAVWMGLEAFSGWVERKHAPVKANIDELTLSLKQFADTGQVAGELASHYGSSLQKIGGDVKGVTKGLADLAEQQRLVKEGISSGEGLENWTPIDPQQVQRIKDLDTALAGLVNNGGATQAKIAFEGLAAAAARQGVSVDELRARFPEYAKATDAAGLAASGAAKGFGDAEANARSLAGTLDQAVHSGQSLKDVFDQLNGANLNLAQAQLTAAGTIRSLDAALKDSSGDMDINNEKGAKAAQTAIDLAKNARDVAQATYEQTGSLGQARDAFENLRGKMIDSIATAGHTRDATDQTRAAAHALADQWFQMPKLADTKVETPGLPQARADIAEHARGLDRIDGRTVNTYVINTIAEVHRTTYTSDTPPANYFKGNRWGGAYEKAAAGTLREAQTYSARNPGRYMIAEPQTGGEAFIPKFGNRRRSRWRSSTESGVLVRGIDRRRGELGEPGRWRCAPGGSPLERAMADWFHSGRTVRADSDQDR